MLAAAAIAASKSLWAPALVQCKIPLRPSSSSNFLRSYHSPLRNWNIRTRRTTTINPNPLTFHLKAFLSDSPSSPGRASRASPLHPVSVF